MKVAIIGAGLAGLACAHELEHLGIVPDLYEKNGFIGESFTHCTVLLRVINNPPRGDFISYLNKSLNLNITPLATVKKMMHYGPTKNVMVTGNNLGLLFLRSNTRDSVKNQICSSLKKTRVFLNALVDVHALKNKYDYVVVASGNTTFSKEFGLWYTWSEAYVRGAVVHGNFDTERVEMWINKHYCNHGYAYLAPLSEKKAVIILVTLDCAEEDIGEYWNSFLYYENIRYPIIEEFSLHHITGYVYPKVIDNMIFAGLAGGSLEPFLGFGQYNSLSMGVFAARSIAYGLDYQKLCRDIDKKCLQTYQLRRGFNLLNNKGYDRLLTFMSFPGVRTVLYKTPLNILPVCSGIIRNVLNLTDNN